MSDLRAFALILGLELRRLLRHLRLLVVGTVLTVFVLCGGVCGFSAFGTPSPKVDVVVVDADLRAELEGYADDAKLRSVRWHSEAPPEVEGVLVVVPADPALDAWTVEAETARHAERVVAFVRLAQQRLRVRRAITTEERDSLRDPEALVEAASTLPGEATARLGRVFGVMLWAWVGFLAVATGERIAIERDEGLVGLLRIGTPARVLWLAGLVRAAGLTLPLVLPVLLTLVALGRGVWLASASLVLAEGVAIGTMVGAVERDHQVRIGLLAALLAPLGAVVALAVDRGAALLVWVPGVGSLFLAGGGGLAWGAHVVYAVVLLRLAFWTYALPEPVGPAMVRMWRRRRA
ncbi:MAG: hypothetical protein H6737_22915 [Alphaproteobacteria bacterium]|nr:hypothetical protein [Alphaproteobacteria bacterium]